MSSLSLKITIEVIIYRIYFTHSYNLWHHAMKKLVPQILIPFSIQMNLACEDAETVMDLIQMNTIMLKGSYSILRYSSLKEDEFPESHCRIDF